MEWQAERSRSKLLLLLLVVVCCCWSHHTSMAGRIKDRLEEVHPTDVLQGSAAAAAAARPPHHHRRHHGSGHEGSPSRQRAEEEQEEDGGGRGGGQEAMADFRVQLEKRLARQGADLGAASVRFILELYERMERANHHHHHHHSTTVTTATTDDDDDDVWWPDGIAANTVRALAPSAAAARLRSRHPELSFSFSASAVTQAETTRLAELRIKARETTTPTPTPTPPTPPRTPAEVPTSSARGPLVGRQQAPPPRRAARLARRGNFQRVRVRLLDVAGSRQVERVYVVRWRKDAFDGFEVLDLTRVLRDLARAGLDRFSNGTLEVTLRQTRRPGRRRARRAAAAAAAPTSVGDRSSFAGLTIGADDAMLLVYSQRHPHPLNEDFHGGAKSAGNARSAASTFGNSHQGRRLTMESSGANLEARRTLSDFSLRETRRRRTETASSEEEALDPADAGSEDNFTDDDDDDAVTDAERNRTAQTGSRETPRSRRRAGSSARLWCKVRDMFVDFDTLGWADDIVFPIRYNARACAGRCPSPVDQSLRPTNHAVLQSMMRMHNRKLRRPCCVPVTLRPLMMLYHRKTESGLRSSDVEIRTHPDMIVGQCGCR